MKEAKERKSHSDIAALTLFFNNAYDGLLLLLFFLSFYQHVDDHSIIMADQTVIKKGEFAALLIWSSVAKEHSSANLTRGKKV